MSKPLVAVVGSTGIQGGSVARTILDDPRSRFRVRAITRNPESDKAKELSRLGAEVVRANLNSSEEVKKAFDGAWAVFGVTNWADPENGGDVKQEVAQGKILADAVKACGVEYFVFSSLSYTSKITDGKVHVPHFDSKGQIENYIKEIGIKGIFPAAGAYFENFWTIMPPYDKTEDGTLVWGFPIPPDTLLPLTYSTLDMGRVVLALLNNPEKYINQFIPIAKEYITYKDVFARVEKATGLKTAYHELTPEAFSEILRKANIPVDAEIIGNIFQWVADWGSFGSLGGVRGSKDAATLAEIDLTVCNSLAQLTSLEEAMELEGKSALERFLK